MQSINRVAVLGCLLMTLLAGCSTTDSARPKPTQQAGEPPLEETAQLKKFRNSEHEQQAKLANGEFNRALALLRQNKLEEAYNAFSELNSKYPTLTGPIVNQAIILRKQGQWQQAYDLLSQSAKTHNTNPFLFNELGYISRKLGKFNEAQASYQTAIGIDSTFANAHYNLAVLADLYLHQPALALQEFETYQSLLDTPDKTVEVWIKELQRRVGE